MADIIDNITPGEQREEPVKIASAFEDSVFPSDDEIKKLYESEVHLGLALSPVSLTHYISLEGGDSGKEGVIEEQKKIFTAFLFLPQSDKKSFVSTIQSPAGWKEIPHLLQDKEFGKKTLVYLKGRQAVEAGNGEKNIAASLGETSKLIESNLDFVQQGE
jgi:hypothetical protein